MDSKYSATDVWRKMKTRTFAHARPTKTQINEKKKKKKQKKKKKKKKKKRNAPSDDFDQTSRKHTYINLTPLNPTFI